MYWHSLAWSLAEDLRQRPFIILGTFMEFKEATFKNISGL